MKTQRIELGPRSYDITIGADILHQLGKQVKARLAPSRVVIISDSHVAPLYGETVRNSLGEAGIESDLVIFPAGEESKSLEQLSFLWDQLFASHLDRKSAVVALGGGVTGDLAGFAAATFMRGIPFVQVPTSLLAMVDSSSGGKTGINHEAGKNLLGAFHQPALVWIDVKTLHTLARPELLSGMAEVVKHGMIQDEDYFAFVESHLAEILALNTEALIQVVEGSCRIKGHVVSQDEREKGIRAYLNFGHTFGHAYEALSHYQIRHGEAVAIGMVQACHFAELAGRSQPEVRKRMVAVLETLGLPVRPPETNAEEVLACMYGDKKTERSQLRLVLTPTIGSAELFPTTDSDMVLKAICR